MWLPGTGFAPIDPIIVKIFSIRIIFDRNYDSSYPKNMVDFLKGSSKLLFFGLFRAQSVLGISVAVFIWNIYTENC